MGPVGDLLDLSIHPSIYLSSHTRIRPVYFFAKSRVDNLHLEEPFQWFCVHILATIHFYHSFGPLRPIFIGQFECFCVGAEDAFMSHNINVPPSI